MAKKKKASSSNSTTAVGILSGIFIVLMALIAQFFLGIDVLNLDEETDTEQRTAVETVTGSDWYRLYFTEPLNTNDRSLHTGSALENDILDSINNATTSIDAVFYELNLASVSNALVAAKNRGVTVRLVVDDEAFVEREEIQPDNSTLDILEAGGFQLFCGSSTPNNYDVRCDDRSALMHNKFLIIDGLEVFTGSANYTHNGIYNNNNNVLVLRSQRVVENYEYIFNLMFEQGAFVSRDVQDYELPNRRFRVNDVLIENYFSPYDANELEARIVELIGDADQSMYLLTNILTLDSIGDPIIARHRAGVEVQALFELTQSLRGQLPRLGCAGISVKQDGNPNTFHHKAIVIDGSIVITGSFNFSQNAKSNSENVTIIHSPEIAAAFIEEFNRRFNDPNTRIPTRAQMGC